MADIEERPILAAAAVISGLSAGAPMILGIVPQIGGIVLALAPVSAIAGIVSIYAGIKVYQKAV